MTQQLDNLHRKENEIARLMTENLRLRRGINRALDALYPSDNARNVQSVGVAVEVLSALFHEQLNPATKEHT